MAPFFANNSVVFCKANDLLHVPTRIRSAVHNRKPSLQWIDKVGALTFLLSRKKGRIDISRPEIGNSGP